MNPGSLRVCAIFLVLLASGITASARAEGAGPCVGAVHRQFDFWIGRWRVTDAATGQKAGTSLIERLYGGCAIRENWSGSGLEGGSLNVVDRESGKWHQTWVDSSGARREFIGEMQDGRMVLVANVPRRGDPASSTQLRMTFTANADGSVRQFSDASNDGGATWSPRYDLVYRRAERKP